MAGPIKNKYVADDFSPALDPTPSMRQAAEARAGLSPREEALLDITERMEKAGPPVRSLLTAFIRDDPGAFLGTMPTKTDITGAERVKALKDEVLRASLMRMGTSDMAALDRFDKHIGHLESKIAALERHAGRKAMHQQMEDEWLMPSAVPRVSDPGELPPLVQEAEPALIPWWRSDRQKQLTRLRQLAGYGEDEGEMGRYQQELLKARKMSSQEAEMRRRREAARKAALELQEIDDMIRESVGEE